MVTVLLSPCSTMGKTRVFALALAVAVAQLVSVSVGHVALTFPAARRFDLDFLDNLRTKAPCGMPKGKEGGPVQMCFLIMTTPIVTFCL